MWYQQHLRTEVRLTVPIPMDNALPTALTGNFGETASTTATPVGGQTIGGGFDPDSPLEWCAASETYSTSIDYNKCEVDYKTNIF